jgi:hypothetical protein
VPAWAGVAKMGWTSKVLQAENKGTPKKKLKTKEIKELRFVLEFYLGWP